MVAAFVLAQQGPAATIRTMAGVLQGLTGFAVFCFLVATLLVPLGTAPAFTLATAGALLTQAAWLLLRRPRPQAAAADHRHLVPPADQTDRLRRASASPPTP